MCRTLVSIVFLARVAIPWLKIRAQQRNRVRAAPLSLSSGRPPRLLLFRLVLLSPGSSPITTFPRISRGDAISLFLRYQPGPFSCWLAPFFPNKMDCRPLPAFVKRYRRWPLSFAASRNHSALVLGLGMCTSNLWASPNARSERVFPFFLPPFPRQIGQGVDHGRAPLFQFLLGLPYVPLVGPSFRRPGSNQIACSPFRRGGLTLAAN